MTVWWGTEVECVSAVARLERNGKLSPAAIETALRRLEALKSEWNEVAPSVSIRESAARLLRTHSLRAPDALQLAAALSWMESGSEFVCLDKRLSTAADLEGLRLVEIGPA